MTMAQWDEAEARWQETSNFIAHYASEFYDPVKAHEYYLRTRELKGRQSTMGMSEEQKSGWDYAKNQIDERKKADIEGAGEQRQAAVEKLRETATAKRQEISDKLRSLLESIRDKKSADLESLSVEQDSAIAKLVADQKAKSAQIREAAAQKIAALPPIPEGVSTEQRAKLAAQRAEQIAKINGDRFNDLIGLAVKGQQDQGKILSDTESKRTALAESTKQQQEQAKAQATASRDVVREGLKAAVDKARTDYEARKEQIKAEYEATAQREYEGILSNLPGGSSSKSKSSSKKDDKKSGSGPTGKTISLDEGARQAVERAKAAKR